MAIGKRVKTRRGGGCSDPHSQAHMTQTWVVFEIDSEIVSEIVSEWNYNRKLCVKVEVIGWEIT
jgi:hypothetical protein